MENLDDILWRTFALNSCCQSVYRTCYCPRCIMQQSIWCDFLPVILWIMDIYCVWDSDWNLISFHAPLNSFPVANDFPRKKPLPYPTIFGLKTLKIDYICQQESIPVGCVSPACWPWGVFRVCARECVCVLGGYLGVCVQGYPLDPEAHTAPGPRPDTLPLPPSADTHSVPKARHPLWTDKHLWKHYLAPNFVWGRTNLVRRHAL